MTHPAEAKKNCTQARNKNQSIKWPQENALKVLNGTNTRCATEMQAQRYLRGREEPDLTVTNSRIDPAESNIKVDRKGPDQVTFNSNASN